MPPALLAALLATAAGPWATVNVCDTAKHPDAIGIRASMPGFPKHARLAMRFRVQYRTDSGWADLGVARGYAVESGWSFTFAHSANAVTLRGMVRFRTRRHGSATRVTE